MIPSLAKICGLTALSESFPTNQKFLIAPHLILSRIFRQLYKRPEDFFRILENLRQARRVDRDDLVEKRDKGLAQYQHTIPLPSPTPMLKLLDFMYNG